MKININGLVKKVYWLIAGIILMVALCMSISLIDPSYGLKISSVRSGSMSPAIKTGSVVVILPKKEYEVGDVITFQSNNPSVKKFTTTHRIVNTETVASKTFFVTQGDSNPEKDSEKLESGQILGRVIFSIPLLGYLLNFAKTQAGFLFLIIVPSTIIVITEIFNIKNEITKKLKNKSSYA